MAAAPMDPFLLDDEEETLSLLVNKSLTVSDLKERLESLSKRFTQDFAQAPDITTTWTTLVESAQGLGFGGLPPSQAPPQQQVPAVSQASVSLPVAFESEKGERHLQATAALLGIASERTVVSLTLGALKSMMSSADHAQAKQDQFQSLLGTRVLLLKVMEYYYRQRAARLSVMAECVRIEQDVDSPYHDTVSTMLKGLENTVGGGGGAENDFKRGLFRSLLSTAARQDAPFTREQLEKARQLENEQGSSNATATPLSNNNNRSFVMPHQETSSAHHAWKQFCADALEIKRVLTRREQLEAMEALVALLYTMAVSRADLALILLAFGGNKAFFTHPDYYSPDRRLSKLAGLICAEAAALWRIDSDDDSGEHPLLKGMPGDAAAMELQALASLLQDSALQIQNQLAQRSSNAIPILSGGGGGVSMVPDPQQPQDQAVIVEAPEALAVLAFGLLLVSASSRSSGSDGNGDSSLNELGMSLVNLANDGDVFGYFEAVMRTLVEMVPVPQESKEGEDGSKTDSMEEETSSEKPELSSSSLIYAYVGRELLSASVQLFKDTLATGHSGAVENVTVLCNLAATINRNSPALSTQFWKEWNSYGSGSKPSAHCQLMQAAMDLVEAEMSKREIHVEQFLPATSPFVRFVSAFVHAPEWVEAACLNLFPQGLLSRALMSAAARGSSKSFLKARNSFLESICALSGTSVSSRTSMDSLRQSLDSEIGPDQSVPQLLLQIIVESNNTQVATSGLATLSHLLKGAPERWTCKVARTMEWMQRTDGMWRELQSKGNFSLAREATNLVHQLVVNTSTLVFSETIDDTMAMELLGIAETSVTTSVELLASSMAITLGTQQLSYESAGAIMNCVAAALQYTGPIIDLHPSARVRAAAYNFRARLVNMLVARLGVGEAVMYYAVAPVSLCITQMMEEGLRDAAVIRAMSAENSSNLFQTTMKFGNNSGKNDSGALSALRTVVADLETLSFDFGGMVARGWLGDEDDALSPLRAANCALSLLGQWLYVVELSQGAGSAVDISTQSPFYLLAARASPPPPSRSNLSLSSAWTDAGVPYIVLLSHYMTIVGNGPTEELIASKAARFLSSSVSHGKMSLTSGDKDAGDKLFIAIFNSDGFQSAMRKCIQCALSTVGKDPDSHANPHLLDVGLHCLQALADSTEVSLEVAAKIFGNQADSSLPKSMIDVVKSVTATLESKKNSTGELSQHVEKGMLRDIRVASGCLNVVTKLLKSVRSVGERQNGNPTILALSTVLDDHPSLLPLLFSIISVCGQPLPTKSAGEQYAAIALLDFSRLALDAASVEIASLPLAPNDSRTTAAASALESSFEDNLSRIVALSRNFTAVPAFSVLEPLYQSFHARIGVTEQSGLPSASHMIRTFSALGTTSMGFDENPLRYKFVEDWISSLPISDDVAPSTSFRELSISYNLLTSELGRLLAWKSFTALLSMLEVKQWRGKSKSTSLLSVRMASETVSALLDNLVALEGLQDPSFLAGEARDMTTALSCLPIHFVSLTDISTGVEQDSWVASMDSIASCCKKLMSGAFEPQYLFKCLEQLLVSAVAMLAPSNSVLSTPEGRRVCLAIGEVACSVLRRTGLAVSGEGTAANGRGCLTVGISVLASLVGREDQKSGADPWGNGGYAMKLYGMFRDFDVIRTVVRQVGLNDSDDQQSTHKKSEMKLLVLALLGKLAVVGDPDVLSLLVDSEISLILPKNSVFSKSTGTSFPTRGYLLSPGKDRHDQDNPEHLVWRASMEFVAAALRSVSRISRNEVTDRFFELALDFISVNKNAVLECLQQCASVSYAGDFPVLTLNVLRETGLLMSIVNELCATGAVDLFKRGYPDLFELLGRLSESLLPSMSSFLGASASSRQLFRAIDELEEADSMTPLPRLAALGPKYFVLAHGISNGRHEAIRYSHFVSRCSTAVTIEDRKAQEMDRATPSPRGRSGSDPHSLTELEIKCQNAVQCKLAFQIEYEAGQVLFFTLSTLWRTHPASASFVMYTEDEAKKLDAMNLVRPGMTIAFRPPSHVGASLLIQDAASFSRRAKTPRIQYGKVVQSNTVNRCWEVLLSDTETPEHHFVSDWQLAGIEDPQRRRGMLEFAAAPQSSSELQSKDFFSKPSVGHLILALRWCSQFQTESKDRTVPTRGVSLATRLAELTTMFLGTEVSIHREIQERESSKTSLKTLSLQVLDLFGEEADFTKLFAGSGSVPIQRNGLLESVVCSDTWSVARSQMREELLMATEHLQVQSHGRRRSFERQYLRRDSSSSMASPFRGLGI